MYRGNVNSQIVHTDRCVHGRRLKNANIRQFNTWDEAIISGFTACKCCDPVAKNEPVRSEAITDYCKENGITLSLQKDKLFIKSAFAQWILQANSEGEIELLHKNTCGNANSYHKQNYKYKTIKKLLKYIVNHDDYRENNPVKNNDPFFYYFGQSSKSMINSRHIKKNDAWLRAKGSKTRKKTDKNKAKAKQKNRDVSRVLALIDGLSATY